MSRRRSGVVPARNVEPVCKPLPHRAPGNTPALHSSQAAPSTLLRWDDARKEQEVKLQADGCEGVAKSWSVETCRACPESGVDRNDVRAGLKKRSAKITIRGSADGRLHV